MPLTVRSQLVLCAVLLAPALAQAEASSAPPPAAGADEANDPKARTLEERVSDLKEKIFRKTRLTNLQEMATGGDVATGPKTVLVHRNEMGSSFHLESVSYALDGAPIYSKVDADGDLEKPQEFEIFNGRIAPGDHQLAVQLTYRGTGHGLVNYHRGYKFKVESSFAFSVEPGKVNTVKVVGFEKGGLTADLKDRPAIRFDVDVQEEAAASAKALAAEGSGK